MITDKEAQKAANTIIEYCQQLKTCEKCEIRYFCMNYEGSFGDLEKYEE